MTRSRNRQHSDDAVEALERRRRGKGPSDTPKVPRGTTFTYLTALLLLAGISVTQYLLTNQIAARQESAALLVNTAGRQRMLSQRITRVAEEMAEGSLDSAIGKTSLHKSVDRMDLSEHQLLNGDAKLGIPPATSTRLKAIYFGPPVRLQSQVDTFLAHTRAFAAKPVVTLADPDLRAIVASASSPLLNGLDIATAEYQAASEHDIRHLRNQLRTLTGIMLLVLALEALLVFRPLFDRLNSLIRTLSTASTTDFLTGVMNRRAFLDSVGRELARADRLKQSMCLMIADIDHFKLINDTYGHPTGDLVIKHFAAIAEANMRTGDCLGRLGGTEFSILMPGTTLAGAQLAAERICERFGSVTAAVTPLAHRVRSTCSIGLIMASGGTTSHLLADADTVLYRAKQAGNRVEAGESTAGDKPDENLDTPEAELEG